MTFRSWFRHGTDRRQTTATIWGGYKR